MGKVKTAAESKTITVTDAGKQRNKHIKALKRGEGPLAAEVPDGAHVVVVKKKDAKAVRSFKKSMKPYRKVAKAFGVKKFTKMITG